MPGIAFIPAVSREGAVTDLAGAFARAGFAGVFFGDVAGLAAAFRVAGFFAVAFFAGTGFFGAAAGRFAGDATVSGLWPAGCCA
jgi:hypothetical protein